MRLRNRFVSLASSAAAVLMLIAGCAASQAGEKVLARLDGTVITVDDVERRMEGIPPAMRRAASAQVRDLVEDIVAERCLLREAERRGFQRDKEVQDLIAAARRKIVVAKLVEKEIDDNVRLDPDEARRYYDGHRDEFMTPLVLRASHILVAGEEEAYNLHRALVEGADFEETARAKSLDTTARRGGDLGFFQKGQFVSEFENAVFQMKKGELGQPVKTRFGYHLIKLTDRVPPSLRDFESVKGMIEEKLLKGKRSEAFRRLVDRLKKGARIEMDEKALEEFKHGAE